MFYKGILKTYDVKSRQGIIFLIDTEIDVQFAGDDLSSLVVEPVIGERVKCMLIDQNQEKHAKYIVRLDYKNARTEKPLNNIFYSETEDLKALKENEGLQKEADSEQGLSQSPASMSTDDLSGTVVYDPDRALNLTQESDLTHHTIQQAPYQIPHLNLQIENALMTESTESTESNDLNLYEGNPIEQDVAETEPSLAELELLALNDEFTESNAKQESIFAQTDQAQAAIESVQHSSTTSGLLTDQDSHKIIEYQKISDLMQQHKKIKIDVAPMQNQTNQTASDVDPFAWHQQNQNESVSVEGIEDLNQWQKKTTAEPSKVKTKLAYKTYKPKKARKVKKQFNPWLIAGIVVILILVNVGVMGYKKFQNYQAEQAAKAQLYLLEQERIIEEQRLKHGKLPNKILSDKSLDELLGKDRSQIQQNSSENTKPN